MMPTSFQISEFLKQISEENKENFAHLLLNPSFSCWERHKKMWNTHEWTTWQGLEIQLIPILFAPFLEEIEQDWQHFLHTKIVKVEENALENALLYAGQELSYLAQRVWFQPSAPDCVIHLQNKTQQRNYATNEINETLFSFWQYYPVLWALMLKKSQQIRNFIFTLFEKIENDILDICSLLAITKENFVVQALHFGYSDAHHHGQSVVLLEISNQKIIFKPRSGAIDEAFYTFCSFLNEEAANENNCCPLFALPQGVNKQSHSWFVYIEPHSCIQTSEIQRFYFRQGAAIALLHLLGATDFHAGNVIASGEFPYLIDLECLFTLGYESPPSALWEKMGFLDTMKTCLYTGLTPFWSVRKDKMNTYYASGVAYSGRNFVFQSPYLAHLSSGHKIAFRYETDEKTNHLPLLHERRVDYQDFTSFIIEGYAFAYRLLEKQKTLLLSEKSPLQTFKNQKVRRLFKNTGTYAEILFFSLLPKHLTSFEAYKNCILSNLKTNIVDDIHQKVMQTEAEALQRRDIPVFYTEVDKNCIFAEFDLKVLGDFEAKTAFDETFQRLTMMQESQLLLYIELIKGSFALTEVSNENLHFSDKFQYQDYSEENLQSASILCLQKIVHDIKKLALHTPEGTTWLHLNAFNPQEVRLPLDLMTCPFYEGSAGVAFFLLHYGVLCKDEESIHLAQKALIFSIKQTIFVLKQEENPLLSAFTGALSVVYVCAVFSELLQDDTWKNEGISILNTIQNWQHHAEDYLGGTAGALVLFLHLQRHFKWNLSVSMQAEIDNHTQKIVSFVEEVLQNTHKMRVGIAHGYAGFGYALFLAGEKYHTLAQKCIETEFSLLDDFFIQNPTMVNWWCAGAVGIHMAYSQMPTLTSASQRTWLAQKITEHQEKGHFHLCCGRSASLFSLLENEDKERFRLQNQKNNWDMLQFYRSMGKWKHHTVAEGNTMIGLFTGVSGIGMMLLKLLYGEKVRNFMLLK